MLPMLVALLVTAAPEVDQAAALLEQGDFPQVVKSLDAALQKPGLLDVDKVEMYRLLGMAQLYQGDEAKARAAFEKLLATRPDYSLPPSAPPKVRQLFANIIDDIKRQRPKPVTLRTEPIGPVLPGEPLEIRATLENLGPTARARLYYRRSGMLVFNSADFIQLPSGPSEPAPNRFKATIPAYHLPPEAKGYDLEYYLEVVDAAQRRLAGRGEQTQPLSLRVGAGQVPEPPGPVWYKNPWVLTGLGVAVIGVGAGIAAVSSSRPTGSLPITIQIQEGGTAP
jgi:tetratricopeptide (TPR) repeat protein